MATKLTNLTQGTIIGDDDLIYAVINGESVKMLKSDFANSLVSTGDDGHVSGVIEWTGTGLTFTSVELYWRKNNSLFYSNGVERTSVAADPTDPRIDVFYGDDSGDWNIKKGTADPAPTKPTVDDTETQVEISFVTIDAGSTEPSEFEIITVYDEYGTIAGGESDVTLTSNGTLNSTEQAESGTKSIKFDGAGLGDNAYFELDTIKETSALVSVSFYVYLETVINNKFWLRLYNLALTQQIGNKIIIQNSTYGFNSFLVDEWQKITIPASAFNVGVLQYQQILIQNKKNGATFFWDNVQIQEGNGGATLPSNIYARDIQTDTADFDNNLSSADDTVQKALDTIDDLVIGGSGGALEYQTETTGTTTVLTTQKGLNKLYPFNKETAQTIQVDTGAYVLNDVVNIERRGLGSIEFLQGVGVSLKGVRDIDNRYFINDIDSIVSILCRGSEEFSIIGNLTRGGTGAVTTSSYSDLFDGDINQPITVIGTGFSANMQDPILTGNATLISWVFVNNYQITLNITETGSVGDLITVTYNNSDVFVDADALEVKKVTLYDTNDLRHYYRLASDANDYKSTLDGTANNITFSGTDAEFNGSTSYIDLADDDTLSYGNGTTDEDLSFTFMVNLDSIAAQQYFISKMISGSDSEYRLAINTSTEIILQTRNNVVPVGTQQGRYDPFGITTGTWFHLGVTKVAGVFKFYLDGVPVTTASSTSGTYAAMDNDTGVFRIGAIPYDGTAAMDGKMKGLGLWNIALSDAEMLDLATDQIAGIPIL